MSDMPEPKSDPLAETKEHVVCMVDREALLKKEDPDEERQCWLRVGDIPYSD